MSDSSRVRVSIVAESSYGTTPGSPAMLVLPITGVSLKDRIGYQQSNVLNSSRDVEDLVRLDKSAGGGIPCELRYSPSGGGLNLAIQSVLCSTFSAAVTTGSCAITSGNNEITRAAGSFVSDGYEVGDIIKVSDYSSGVEYRRLSSVAALTLGVEGEDFNATDAAVTVTRGARIKNGTTTPSFTVEVAYLDLQIAHIFTGVVFAQADLNVAVGQLATIGFSMEGKTSTRVDTNTGTTDQFIASATYTAAASHPSLDPVGVTEIQVGGSDYAASSIAASWNNNVRGRQQLGALGPQSMARGQFAVSGRVTAYFDSFDDHDDYADNVATDMWFVILDANSRGYSVSYPQAKFSDVENPVASNNSDIFKTLAVTAYKDPTEGCTVRLQRWGD